MLFLDLSGPWLVLLWREQQQLFVFPVAWQVLIVVSLPASLVVLWLSSLVSFVVRQSFPASRLHRVVVSVLRLTFVFQEL